MQIVDDGCNFVRDAWFLWIEVPKEVETNSIIKGGPLCIPVFKTVSYDLSNQPALEDVTMHIHAPLLVLVGSRQFHIEFQGHTRQVLLLNRPSDRATKAEKSLAEKSAGQAGHGRGGFDHQFWQSVDWLFMELMMVHGQMMN